MAEQHLFDATRLQAAVHEVMLGFGSHERECELVSGNLVRANLAGHDSHGIGMLPRYARAFQEGDLQPNQQIAIRQDSGFMLALDGQMGFGQAVGHQAMQLGIERAKEHGTCIMALANAHHLGRIGEWAELAVSQDLVSIHFVNVISRPIVAPWGGTDARYGTNPFTAGIPMSSGEPFILDFATSVIAQGKTRVAYNKGVPLAPGQMLDNNGLPTTDPVFGVMSPLGALLPFGEHKGFGMAMLCELLGGALAGGWSVDGPADGKQRVVNGMLTILIDPSRLADRKTFESQAQQTAEWVKASAPGAGVSQVQLAGQPERQTAVARKQQGIPVDSRTWDDILQAGESLGIQAQRINQHVGL